MLALSRAVSKSDPVLTRHAAINSGKEREDEEGVGHPNQINRISPLPSVLTQPGLASKSLCNQE